jgi:hypothetical protein
MRIFQLRQPKDYPDPPSIWAQALNHEEKSPNVSPPSRGQSKKAEKSLGRQTEDQEQVEVTKA